MALLPAVVDKLGDKWRAYYLLDKYHHLVKSISKYIELVFEGQSPSRSIQVTFPID